MREGDRNSSFFHNSTKQRRNINIIYKIKGVRGNIVEGPKEIAEEIVDIFNKYLIYKIKGVRGNIMEDPREIAQEIVDFLISLQKIRIKCLLVDFLKNI